MKELVDKVVEESKKKGLNINSKKTECMILSKRDSNVKINHMKRTMESVTQKFYE